MKNNFITKIIGASLAIAMMIGVGAGVNFVKEAKEVNADSSYSYTFSSKQFTANDQTKSLGGVNWTAAGSGSFWGYDSTKGQQFGSGSAPSRDLTLTTSGIPGTISSVVVNASTANSATANINCTIGGAAFGNQAQSLSTSNSPYTFSGSASGEIVINLKQPSTSKALYIKGISVTYSTGQPEAQLTGISLKTPATKTAYYPGENFDPTGLSITLSYDIADPVDVTYNNETKDDFSWSPTTITEAGNVQIQYKEHTGMKVNQAVTLVTPLTVAQAKNAIDAAQNHVVQNAYVQGKISQIDSFSDEHSSITYWISDDGTTANQFEVFGGKGLNKAAFNSIDDVELGATVVVFGLIKLYEETTYEFASGNYLKSYTEPVKTLVSISLSGNFPTSFFVNEEFSHAGMIVKAKYDNNSTKDVTEQATFSSPAMAQAKRQVVTVTYTEGGVTKTTTYRIIVRTRITDQFNKFTGDTVTDGDYIIYYEGHILKNTITSNRADFVEHEIVGLTYNATDNNLIWRIAKDGDYYTIYNARVDKYLGSGSKNTAILIDDKTDDRAKWTIHVSEGTYDFENLARSTGNTPANKWLRNNEDYGFACYSTNTGGALTLFKRGALTQFYNSITQTSLSYRYTLEDGVYSYSNVAIRFTGSVSVEHWEEIDSKYTIKAYGIMMAQTSAITLYGQDSTIKGLYQGILNMYSVDESFSTVNGQKYIRGYENKIKCFMTEVPDSETHPYKLGNEYGWNLYKNIDDSLDGASQTALTTSYTGVAFIKTQTGGVIFMNEENITAGELAFKLANNGTTFDNEEIEGSMKQMANLNVAA